MESARFEKSRGGVFVVRYGAADEMLPDRQQPLLAALRTETDGCAVVFVLAPHLWKVDMTVPRFWNEVVLDRTLALRAMGIVSGSVAVRAATHSFRVANMLRGVDLPVSSFDDEATAVAWARARIGATVPT